MGELPPPLGALRFEQVVRERRKNGEQSSRPIDRRAVCSREVSPGALVLPPLLPFEAVLSDPAGLLERCSGTFLLPPVDADEGGGSAKPPLMRCSRCRVARYSSAAAQRSDWKGRGRGRGGGGGGGGVGLHWRECAALRAFAAEASESKTGNNKVPPASIRLAARIFWKRAALLGEEEEEEKEEEEEMKDGESRWWSSPRAVAALRHHFPGLPDGRKVAVAAAAAAARSYMFGALTDDEKRRAEAEEAEAEVGGEGQGNSSSSSSPSPPTSSPLSQLLLPPPRKLAELLATLACNAHALSDASQGTLLPYGVGLFPAAAMLNHSCWPSAAVVFRPSCPSGGGASGGGGGHGGEGEGGDGRRLEARALRRLREGEEATIAYVDPCCPRPERRRALLEGYSFDIDLDLDGGERLQKGEGQEEEEDSPVVARWQGRVPFPPGGSPAAETTFAVSAALHEARPRAATEGGGEEARARRAPLEGVCCCVAGGSGGDGAAASAAEAGCGGIAWIEEEEEEEEEGEGETEEEEEGEEGGKASTGGERQRRQRRRQRRRKTVRVLAWGGRSAFPSDGALSFYASTSASAALAAALSSEALAAGDSAGALSLARAGREALLKAATNAENSSLPCPSPASSYVAARLDDALTHAAVSVGGGGNLSLALEAARRAVPALHLRCSPPGHPPRAFALATLAKLEAAALGNGCIAAGGGGGFFGGGGGGAGGVVSIERVRLAAEAARRAAEEVRVCFPGSEREAEFREMAEGLRAEAEAARRMGM